MGHHDCHKKKCEDKYVIKCLPCTIYKSGHYCLGKDFEWGRDTPAITIMSDNVVLDFNQRNIDIRVATELPLIYVKNSKNVKLLNVNVIGISQGQYASKALLVEDSSVIEVKGLFVLDLATEGVKFLNVTNLELIDSTFQNSAQKPIKVLKFDSVINLTYTNSKSYGVNFLTINSKNILFDYLQIDESDYLTEDGTQEMIDFVGCENIKVSNSNIIGAFGENGVGGTCLRFQTSKVIEVSNNTIKTGYDLGGGGVGGVFFSAVEGRCDGATVKNNTILCRRVDPEEPIVPNVLGIILFGGIHISIEGNNIIGNGEEGSAGIGVLSLGGVSEYVHVRNNNITGSNYGLLDSFYDIFGYSRFCIFTDNIVSGNEVNVNVNSPDNSAFDNITIYSAPAMSSLSVTKAISGLSESEINSLAEKLKR